MGPQCVVKCDGGVGVGGDGWSDLVGRLIGQINISWAERVLTSSDNEQKQKYNKICVFEVEMTLKTMKTIDEIQYFTTYSLLQSVLQVQRAGLTSFTGHIWPQGHSLPMPAVDAVQNSTDVTGHCATVQLAESLLPPLHK